MDEIDFKKHFTKAISLCEDYSTLTTESDEIDMIWFTPKQLRKYTEYCFRARMSNDNNKKET